jgi:predicted ArsR family transcriptional regulator
VTVVTEIRGKTEQRVIAVISVLKGATAPVTYDDLHNQTGTAYDVLLYILATLCEIGLVEREEVAEGPGRPRVHFQWIKRDKARAIGARSA